MIEQTSIRIPAADGFELSAVVLSPKDIPVRANIQFHAGTVIKKEFYLKMCSFLASKGYRIILFDYRGVGASKPDSLRGFNASISDWGRKDARGVLDWIKNEYPEVPTHLFAHSMGGQLLGLMSNWNMLDKVIVVASSSGNYHNFEPSYRRKVKWSSNIFFPIILPIWGYAPGIFGLGEDWPKGVAEEWWKNSRGNTLMAHYMEHQFSDTHYRTVDKEITAWFFPDDIMATPKTLPNYQKSYPNAKVNAYTIRPASCNLKEIGHFGVFKEKSKDTLWEELDYFFSQ